MKISVLIISKDRFKELKRCLYSVKNQTILPDRVVVVEDVANNQYCSQKYLDSIFPSQVKCEYHKVKYYNIAKSRNKTLKSSKNSILIFLDDDVVLPNTFIRDVKYYCQKYPKIAGFVPRILPLEKNIISWFGSHYMNGGWRFRKKMVSIQHFAFPTVVLRSFVIRKHQLQFDEKTKTGEDIIFLRKLTQTGERLYFLPTLISYHKFASSFLDFCKKHYLYGKDFVYQEEILNNDVTDDFFPSRKIELIFFPIFMVITLFKISMEEIRHLRLEKKFFVLVIAHVFLNFLGIYSSERGVNKLFISLRKIL